MNQPDWEEWNEIPEMPTRPTEGHKGDFGRVVVVAGSQGMAGAAALSGAAALRAGAGLVTVACPAPVVGTITALCSALMTMPQRTDAVGSLSRVCLKSVLKIRNNVLAVGPGLTQEYGCIRLVHGLVRKVETPLVIDADGLGTLVGALDVLKERPGPTVLTPHPGEFARLMGMTIPDVQADRVNLAVRFAREHKIILVLKGAGTIVTDGQRVAVNRTGNPGMATAGMGDVLTGITAGLIAQRMDPMQAARLAVHCHGLAGDRVVQQTGSTAALVATDIIDTLPMVLHNSRVVPT